MSFPCKISARIWGEIISTFGTECDGTPLPSNAWCGEPAAAGSRMSTGPSPWVASPVSLPVAPAASVPPPEHQVRTLWTSRADQPVTSSVRWFPIPTSPSNMELWPWGISCCWHRPFWVTSGSVLVPCAGVSFVWRDCNSRIISANSPTVAATLVTVLSSLFILASMSSAALAPMSSPLGASRDPGPDWPWVAASGLCISTGKDSPSLGWRSICNNPAFLTEDGADMPLRAIRLSALALSIPPYQRQRSVQTFSQPWFQINPATFQSRDRKFVLTVP